MKSLFIITSTAVALTFCGCQNSPKEYKEPISEEETRKSEIYILKDVVQLKGIDDGIKYSSVDIDYYTDNHSERLKELYINYCRSYNGIGEKYISNKELYEEYELGFFGGRLRVENAKNALN